MGDVRSLSQDKVQGNEEEKQAAQKRFAEISHGKSTACALCGMTHLKPLQTHSCWRVRTEANNILLAQPMRCCQTLRSGEYTTDMAKRG